ncbi:hypothetical protein ACH50P_22525, partial [Sulfitobacter sp. M22386]
LRLLASGKCAYCEGLISGVGAREVEHYRPKGGVAEDTSHPGYWWLAHDWENLLPTCILCNQSRRQHIVTPEMSREEVEKLLFSRASTSHGKANQFAVSGARATCHACDLETEDPLLIDPCRQDPKQEIGWDFSGELPRAVPKLRENAPSKYGVYTIETCALNRAELVLERIPVLLPLRLLRDSIKCRVEAWTGDAAELAAIRAQAEAMLLFSHTGQAHSGMVIEFIENTLEELEQWLVEKGSEL